MFGCPLCGNLKFSPFRCHSRFCPTCSVKYSIDRTTSMSFKIINVQHRHCVFTTAEELRPFFLLDRSLLGCLFSAVRSVVLRLFHKDNIPSAETLNGILTFTVSSLRAVLETLSIGAIKPISIIRFSVMPFRLIDSYDGEHVTLHYNRHEDNKYISETIPAIDFIQRLIRHIPEKHFKMIRYYGIYARHRKSDDKLYRAISKEKHAVFRSFNRWREQILAAFGYDPLKCTNCGTIMIFLELYFDHKRVYLDELYERTMRKHHHCRAPSPT